MKSLASIGCVLVLLLLLLAPAGADVVLGAGSRTAGMAGAGLAIVDSTSECSKGNPAAPAITGHNSFVRFPSFSLQNRGINPVDLVDYLSTASDLNSDRALDAARQFLGQPVTMGFSTDTGLGLGPVVIEASGMAVARLVPDAQLLEWQRSGGVGDPPAGSTAEMQAGVIYTLPSVAFSHRFGGFKEDSSLRDAAIGVRVRAINARFHQETISYSGGDVNSTGSDDIKSTSYSADLGLITRAKGSGITSALVVTNLICPKLDSIRQERTIDFGISKRIAGGVVLAGDLRNLTGAYDRKMIAAGGIEFAPLKWLRARAGISTRGAALGLSIGPINIAYAARGPLYMEDLLR